MRDARGCAKLSLDLDKERLKKQSVDQMMPAARSAAIFSAS
jgi:hypothetical protein